MYNFVFAVIAFLRETEAACDALLRCEENSNKIAEAQGKIAGCGLLTAKIEKHFMIEDSILEIFLEKYPCWTDYKMPTLEDFHNELTYILASEAYKAFMDDIESENVMKKNWLWMKAEKGRDLIFVRGWKSSMQSFDEVVTQFQTAYTKRKQELQFDEEKKGDAEYQQSLSSLDDAQEAAATSEPVPDVDADQPETEALLEGDTVEPNEATESESAWKDPAKYIF